MRKYSCLAVEDEPLAAEVLAEYVAQVPFLELKFHCTDALFALEILQRERIDLIFLDIHLPKLKGPDFIKTLKDPPHVIITTAYQEYALLGYELDVTDYLLKPIEFSRFLLAAEKFRVRQQARPSNHLRSAERPHLFLNVGKKKVKIYLDDILYIESLKEYIRITAKNKTILTKCQLGQIEELLAKNNFLRIHRSFLVATEKIDAFSSTDIEINGKQIPIGRSYKDHVMAALC